MTTIWTGVAEGDRALVSTDSGQHWGSILSGQRPGTPSALYEVRYDDYPDEIRWVKNDEILRLHRGAGVPLPSPAPEESNG
jgi:hypothetical protein